MGFRSSIRTVAAFAASSVFAVIVGGPGGNFFYDLYKSQGYFTDPNATVASVIAFLVWVAASPWFHWIGGGMIGFAAGVWLDYLSRRKRPSHTPEEAAPAEEGPFSRWPDEYRPISVVSQRFVGEQIPVDGYSYSNCVFINATFIYNGTTPVQISGCRIVNATMTSRNPAVSGTVIMLQGLGVLERMTLEVRGNNAIEPATWDKEVPS